MVGAKPYETIKEAMIYTDWEMRKRLKEGLSSGMNSWKEI